MMSPDQERPLKVVHLCSSESGGAGKAAFRLHEGLLELGIDSKLLVLIKKSSETSVLLLAQAGGDTITVQTPGVSSSWKEALGRWEQLTHDHPNRPQGLEMYSDDWSSVHLSKIPAIQEADIVNLHWVSGMLNYDEAALALAGKKVVWTLHDMNPFTGGCHYTGDCRKFVTACGACPQLGSQSHEDLAHQVWKKKIKTLPDIDITVVTPSRWLSECASASAVFRDRKVVVIPNGVPEEIYKPYPKSEIRKALNIPQDASVVLFGADNVLNARKGFMLLLRALANFRAPEGKKVILATFGGLNPSIKIPSPYEVKNLGSLSRDQDLAYVYSLADLLVIPSLEDNLPNTVMEAMACGVPVVGFSIGGIPDMVRDGETGFLAPPGDIEQLAECMYRALFKADRKHMSRRCRQIVLSEYRERQKSSDYLLLYKNLLEKGRSAEILNKKGEELFCAGEMDAAAAAFLDAIRINPFLSTAHNNLGVVKWQSGNAAGAAEFFRTALRYNPLSPEARENLNHVTNAADPRPARTGDRSPLHPPEILIRKPFPQISLVTASYNQGQFLEECIESILAQNYPNLDYVIMDGGSTDNSVQIIKKYEKHLKYWQSKPDGGQYPAITEGFKLTSGEIMGWLNSDDKLHPAALFKVAYFFAKHQEVDWLMGRPVLWDADGNISGVDNFLQPLSRRKYLDFNFDKPFIQQESTFWRRSLWETAGAGLSTKLKLAGDLELWVRFFRHAILHSVDAFIGGYRHHGDQKAVLQAAAYLEEADQAIQDEISAAYSPTHLPPPPAFLEPSTEELCAFIQAHQSSEVTGLYAGTTKCWKSYCANLVTFIKGARSMGNLRIAPFYEREAHVLKAVGIAGWHDVLAEAKELYSLYRKNLHLTEEARISLSQGNLERAELKARQCIDIDSLHTDAYKILGEICTRKGLHADALKHLNEALKADMYDGEVITSLVETFARLGDKDTAEFITNFYRERNPDDAGTFTSISRLLQQ